ncbi:MAG: hypothetical protein RI565_10910, partial [Schleiferiaceae bacterium]|nr:hypothetical protein [Schleiferiaceae bacterium]
ACRSGLAAFDGVAGVKPPLGVWGPFNAPGFFQHTMDTENYKLLAKYDDGFPVLRTLVIPTGYIVGVLLQGGQESSLATGELRILRTIVSPKARLDFIDSPPISNSNSF